MQVTVDELYAANCDERQEFMQALKDHILRHFQLVFLSRTNGKGGRFKESHNML